MDHSVAVSSPAGSAGCADNTSGMSSQNRVLEAVIDASTDFIYAFTREGRFIFANRALCDLLRLKPEEVAGRTFADLNYPEPLASNLQRQIQQVFDTNTIVRAETPFVSPDGNSRIYEYIFSPVLGAEGGVEAVCGTTRDVTEQFAAHKRLLDLNGDLKRLFAQAPGFIAVLRGPDHIFEMGNEAYQALLGQREIVGKSVAQAVPEAVEQGIIELLDGVLSSGEPFIARGFKFGVAERVGAPLREAYLDFIYQPIFNEEQQAVGIFVQGHDVTDQHLAQLDLLKIDRQKDLFIATLAHELRNPLAPIQTGASLLARQGVPAELIATTTAVITRQVRHMARLLDDLLDVSRISNHQMRLRREDTTIQSIVTMALEATEPMIHAKHHALTVNHDDGPVRLHVDPVRMTQVLSNLLSNAAKYTDVGGSIALRSSVSNGACLVSIADSGIGLDGAVLDTVFNMFAQQEEAIDRSQGGLGIGLALVRGLVEMHGGTVHAFSRGLGTGSTFEIRIPLPEAAADPAQGAARSR